MFVERQFVGYNHSKTLNGARYLHGDIIEFDGGDDSFSYYYYYYYYAAGNASCVNRINDKWRKQSRDQVKNDRAKRYVLSLHLKTLSEQFKSSVISVDKLFHSAGAA